MKVAKNSIDRLVFFSKEDLAWPNMLSKAEKILNSPQDLSNADINDLLELYHIKLYFDNNIFLTKWTDDDRATYIAVITRVFGEIRDAFCVLGH